MCIRDRATVICGDSYFNENVDEAKSAVLAMIKEKNPDGVSCRPAFNAGRYGVACGTVAAAVKEELGLPVLTGMYKENPGVDMYKNKVLICETKNSAAGMRAAVKVDVYKRQAECSQKEKELIFIIPIRMI